MSTSTRPWRTKRAAPPADGDTRRKARRPSPACAARATWRLGRDFGMFTLMFLLIATLFAVVWPAGLVDRLLGTTLQRRCVALLSWMAG